MEKFDVSVGKFTLESLTTGMYSDARIVYTILGVVTILVILLIA